MRDVTRQSVVFSVLIGIVLLTAGVSGCNSAIEAESDRADRSDDSAVVTSDNEKDSKTKGDAATVGEVKAPGKNDWPSFRNGDLQQGIAGSDLPKDLELLWKIKVTDGIVTTPAIVDDFVYLPCLNGFLMCLDRKTGNAIWQYRSIEDEDLTKFAPGMKSAPRVTADTVYVGDEDGVLHAIDRKTGKARWKAQTESEIAGAAAVVNDRVVFGSWDSHLYCVDKNTGDLVWQLMTGDRINCSTAIVDNSTFVTGCDGYLRVIDVETGTQVSEMDIGSYIIASPAIRGDELYLGTYDLGVLAINWKTQTVTWQFQPPDQEFPYHASAAVTDQFVLLGGHDKTFRCLERKTGEEVWNFPTQAQINSSAVVVGDRVFFGSDDKHLYSLRIDDGKELWKYNAGGPITAGPAVGEGVIVFGTADRIGYVYCFGKK